MTVKASEKGQALILITLAAIGLFAFAALAIDGSMAFSNKRHAQNAADTSALAGALSYAREGKVDNIETVALARAQSNGYENIAGDTSTLVTVTVTDVLEEECPGDAAGKDIYSGRRRVRDHVRHEHPGRDRVLHEPDHPV